MENPQPCKKYENCHVIGTYTPALTTGRGSQHGYSLTNMDGLRRKSSLRRRSEGCSTDFSVHATNDSDQDANTLIFASSLVQTRAKYLPCSQPPSRMSWPQDCTASYSSRPLPYSRSGPSSSPLLAPKVAELNASKRLAPPAT